ncbi:MULTISPECIES: hypothetical protein [Microvirga]|uniref:hypothetical protein n=1 Tax=Microvirga TaxID=186650 RepID=UPI0021C62FFF|nr:MULTISPECIES: hypothetical protein [unclassified Microvirga]
MMQSIDTARKDYLKRRHGIESFKEGNADLTSVFSLIPGGGTAASKVGSKLAGKLGTQAISTNSGDIAQTLTEANERKYRSAVTSAVRRVVADADPVVLAKWRSVGISPHNQVEARRELFGAAGDLMSRGILAGLPVEVQTDILGARTDLLNDAVIFLSEQSQSQLDQLRVDTDASLSAMKDEMSLLGKGLHALQGELDNSTRAVSALREGIEADLAALEKQMSAPDPSVAVQSAMWREMTPHQKLLALDDGFLPELKGPEREDLRAKLRNVTAIMDRRDVVLNGLSGLGTLGNLAKGIGIPIDNYNLQKNINDASSAVNLISNIALGNWYGAAQSLNGLFGGGGADPDAAAASRHAEIMDTLKKIIDLQIETLRRLEQISEQIQMSTRAILARLEEVESKVDLANEKLLYELVGKPFSACTEFVRTAQAEPYRMRNGMFQSFEDRRRHFDADQGRDTPTFSTCSTLLDQMKIVEPPQTRPEQANLVMMVHQAFRFEHQDVGNRSLYPWIQRRMRDVTYYALGISEKPNCQNRLLSVLSAAPRKFADIPDVKLNCADADIPSYAGYTNVEGAPINASDALEYTLAPGVVREIVETSMFIAPYWELIQNDRNRPPRHRLATEEELAAGQLDRNIPRSMATDWPRRYLDLVNIANAQTLLHSGGLVAERLGERIKALKFGTLVDFKSDEVKRFVAERCVPRAGAAPDDGLKKEEWAKHEYLVLSCLLSDNPAFERNVIDRIIAAGLRAKGAGLFEYDHAVKLRHPAALIELFPDLPLELVTAGDQYGWHLKLVKSDGSPLLVPLPSASALRLNLIDTPNSGSALLDIRDRLLDRVTATAAQTLTENNPEAAYTLRQAFLADPAFGRVPLRTRAEASQFVSLRAGDALHVEAFQFFAELTNDPRDIFVVDHKCVQVRVKACALTYNENVDSTSPSCPPGLVADGSPRMIGGGGTTRQPVVLRQTCALRDIKNVATIPTSFLEGCRIRAEALPAQEGEDVCLRPLQVNRLVDTWRSELHLLFKRMCVLSGNPRCEEMDGVR